MTTALELMAGAVIDAARPASGRTGGVRRQVATSYARRALWKSLLSASGGVTGAGTFPTGGSIVVANHSSHADTAALLAVLPARSRPVVVAAADYWFASAWRSLVCRALVGGVPVRRTGGGREDLLRLAQLARSGRTVVLFPEGTRSRTGEIGEFHSGAIHLARAAGVPLVPVGILGTRRLLAPGGTARLARVEVRIGDPMAPASLEQTRAAVTALVESAPVGARDSRIRRRLAALAGTPRALLFVAGWGAAEALSLPIVTELVVALAVLAAPRSWWRLAVAGAAGATAGAALGWTLAFHGVPAPAPLTTPRMHALVATQVAEEGVAALVHQPFSGVPFKVYIAEFGAAREPLPTVLGHAFPLRFGRLLVVALIAAVVGLAGRRVAHVYPAVALFTLTAFAVGLSRVVGTWR